MRNLLALCALSIAVSSPAQMASNVTPSPGTVWSYSRSSDGTAHLLTSVPFYEAYLNLPFGLDFSAGHGLAYGQLMDGTEFKGNVFGYQVFAKKYVGGDGVFLMGDLHVLVGEAKRPVYGFGLSIGFGF